MKRSLIGLTEPPSKTPKLQQQRRFEVWSEVTESGGPQRAAANTDRAVCLKYYGSGLELSRLLDEEVWSLWTETQELKTAGLNHLATIRAIASLKEWRYWLLQAVNLALDRISVDCPVLRIEPAARHTDLEAVRALFQDFADRALTQHAIVFSYTPKDLVYV